MIRKYGKFIGQMVIGFGILLMGGGVYQEYGYRGLTAFGVLLGLYSFFALWRLKSAGGYNG